ncbi:hydroperoxide isomerase ALOXE3-like [Pelodytes ibericus]
MVVYRVLVATGKEFCAGTSDIISIVLVGELGESSRSPLQGKLFAPRSVNEYEVSCPEDLGQILLVRLYKEQSPLPESAWYCKYVSLISPKGEDYLFPCYLWLSGYMTLEVPEGKGIILSERTNTILVQQRKNELEKQRETHMWKVYAEGAPHCINVDNVRDLPCNDQFSFLKSLSFGFTLAATGFELYLKGFLTCTEPWANLEDIKSVFCFNKTHNADVVSQVWKEDAFFGYQYLNGVNPVLIQKCCKIPANFPVTDQMVAPSLGTSSNLQTELQKGNLFLADYHILQGVPANTINGAQQYLTAPMCLLWKSPKDNLLPLAIQLGQTPGDQTPIFLPSDSEWDWMLAKMWVRCCEFQVHQISSHLLYTHLFAEVFNVATTRQLPMGHPVYKLIVPHLRNTLEINVLARSQLIGPDGLFDQANVTGRGGLPALLKKAMDALTYTSMCLPDDIQSRGVESVPNYYYREDGMKIWSAIERYVSAIINYYYENDVAVHKDPELQAWVAEIFKEGVLEQKSSGIPCSLGTRTDLIKYLTMVMFTCSARHAAVNSGQFDFYSWMPNGPTTMRCPPPTVKGNTTFQSILDTLPQVNTTTLSMATFWVLSREPHEKRPLGNYPDERFTEEKPKKFIKDFQDQLHEISKQITERNQKLNLTYPYLDPKLVENSVSI